MNAFDLLREMKASVDQLHSVWGTFYNCRNQKKLGAVESIEAIKPLLGEAELNYLLYLGLNSITKADGLLHTMDTTPMEREGRYDV